MRRQALAALLAFAAACSTQRATGDTYPRHDRAVLTLEEIQAAKGFGWSAYDLVAQLRPEYLRSRGTASMGNLRPTTAAVYLDGVRYGDVEILRTMNGDHVESIQYMNAADATTRYGTDHVGGALLVKTRVVIRDN